MPIKKQEFYEGAALYALARSGNVRSIEYEPPFFLLNGRLRVLLKYSTKGRSPWGFTFTPAERLLLEKWALISDIVLGLVCGADGVVALTYKAYLKIASLKETAVHIACYRRHGEYYEVNGPEGTLDLKVPPSNWGKILSDYGGMR